MLSGRHKLNYLRETYGCVHQNRYLLLWFVSWVSLVLLCLLFLKNPKFQIDKPLKIFRRGTNT